MSPQAASPTQEKHEGEKKKCNQKCKKNGEERKEERGAGGGGGGELGGWSTVQQISAELCREKPTVCVHCVYVCSCIGVCL